MKRLLVALGLLLAMATPALAVNPDEVLADPALEARARDISEGLRCLVCQNQSIDGSDADLARDLRILVRERLVAGDSNAEVEQYLVDRYGEYVLLQPRLNAHTWLLWAAAPALFVVGLAALWFARKRSARPMAEELSVDERAILQTLESEHGPRTPRN